MPTFISEWLIARGFTALLAKRSAGKTVTMLDMALSIASDRDWQEQPTARGLWVFYIAGEDAEGARDHARAWCANHRVCPDDPDLRFRFVPLAPDLLNKDDCKALTEYLLSVLPQGGRAILFVDTWQRAASRASQNDDDQMQTAVHHIEAIAKSVRGCAVIAFHPPKGREDTILGLSVIENETMGIWLLTDDGGKKKLEVTRLKARGEGDFRLTTFEGVDLGERDCFGRLVTGAVAKLLGGTDLAQHDTARKHAIAKLIVGRLHAIEADPALQHNRESHTSPSSIARALAGQTVTYPGRRESLPQWRALMDELRAMFAVPRHLTAGASYALRILGKNRVGARSIYSRSSAPETAGFNLPNDKREEGRCCHCSASSLMCNGCNAAIGRSLGFLDHCSDHVLQWLQ